MNIDNRFNLLDTVLFDTSIQIGGLGPKDQYLLVSFCLGIGGNLPQLHLRDLQARGEIFLLNDETGKVKNHSLMNHGTFKIETATMVHD